MKNTKQLIPIIAIIACVIHMSGCTGRSTGHDKNNIIARVNDYEITAEDLAEEGGYDSKEEALDRLITESVLIQESQKQNFDKDMAFMKEIERYWKQALLKRLLKKKAKEIADTLDSSGQRMLLEGRNKKIQEELEEWIKNLKDKSRITVYKENLA